MNKATTKSFLEYFPDHSYRYLDRTGEKRPAISSSVRRDDLNEIGYCSYFTVNGFKDGKNDKFESLTSINAFFVDIDGRKNPEELEEIKKRIYPTFIIETGHGHHLYWVLDEPIYREDMTKEEWKEICAKWQEIEDSLVVALDGDMNSKDICRILRVPGTYYWEKNGGSAYIEGTDGVFKIKGIEKNPAKRYTFADVEEAFPIQERKLKKSTDAVASSLTKYAEEEKKDFFARLNKLYPIEERDSFKSLVSGTPETLPKQGMRNQALIITASLMKQAGWKMDKAVDTIVSGGWHGMVAEKGGRKEVENTIKSAYSNNYTYSNKHEIIAHNITPKESQELQEAHTKIAKVKKDVEKLRFSTYEREILNRNPYMRKNEIGIFFNYDHGVYRMMNDQEVSDLILNSLDDDMMFGYRTKKNVSDKVACLLSIIPTLELSKDGGYILNLKNGLLNLETKELLPHTPDFVSLIQFPVDYTPEAKCPIWEDCIKSWTYGDEQQEKALLLQQFSGYTLSSSMNYDKALFLVGDGGNGKSTFVDTIARVIGQEATAHIDLEGLYGQYGMKGLIGKRLNIIEEVSGNYYHSNKLKKLISGEPVTIDIKYKDQFSFTPQAKFMFAVNIMPRVDDTSSATERRICAITFKNNYRNNPNQKLRSSMGLLAGELSGILNWMIEGADNLKEKEKFIITNEQTEMLAEYRQENSSIEGFIKECLEFDKEYYTSTRDVFEEYKRYCILDGRKFKSNITFTKEMRAFGKKENSFSFSERKHSRDTNKYIGLRIVEDWSDEKKARVEYNNF